jgi:hypothetical protein
VEHFATSQSTNRATNKVILIQPLLLVRIVVDVKLLKPPIQIGGFLVYWIIYNDENSLVDYIDV